MTPKAAIALSIGVVTLAGFGAFVWYSSQRKKHAEGVGNILARDLSEAGRSVYSAPDSAVGSNLGSIAGNTDYGVTPLSCDQRQAMYDRQVRAGVPEANRVSLAGCSTSVRSPVATPGERPMV